MHFDGFEAIQRERHDLASRRFLNMAARGRYVQAMNQPLRNANCLKFLLKGLVELVEPFRDFQGLVFFSP